MSPLGRLLVAVALGIPALALLVPRIFPGAEISFWLLRERRARRREKRVDLPRAAAYHGLLPSDERAGAIDDRTWRDLNLDDVFVSLDNTESEPGRQYVYHLLRTPHLRAEPLARLERVVHRFTNDDTTTEQLRTTLRKLDDPRAGELVQLILGELPRRPRAWWLFPLLTATSIACLALIPIWPRALIVWVAVCVANVGVQVIYKSRVKRFVPALHELPGFVEVAQAIGAMHVDEISDETRVLRDGARTLSILRRATWWLMFEPGQANDLVASLYEYVNLLFLLDVNAFMFAIESLRASQPVMRHIFASIGYVDAAQSIAAWRAMLPQWTRPEFTSPLKALHADSVVHPLVAGAVPNSLDVDGASVLITGSNMSGKTTFVRALGVNAVLAQTLHTVCAATWRAPMLRVRTSIERTDSIREGKSHFSQDVALLAQHRILSPQPADLFVLAHHLAVHWKHIRQTVARPRLRLALTLREEVGANAQVARHFRDGPLTDRCEPHGFEFKPLGEPPTSSRRLTPGRLYLLLLSSPDDEHVDISTCGANLPPRRRGGPAASYQLARCRDFLIPYSRTRRRALHDRKATEQACLSARDNFSSTYI